MTARARKLCQGCLWLLAAVAAVVAAWPMDNRIDAALDASRDPSLHELAWWCSKAGEGEMPAAGGIIFSVVFLLAGKPGLGARVFFVMLTCELTGLAGLILRISFGRTRPLAHDPQGFYGIWNHGHLIMGKYEFSSFPSGHAATAVGLAAAAWLVNQRAGMAAAVYALAVMWSRIALDCHHFSDVVASVFVAVPLAMLIKPAMLPAVELQFGNWSRSWRRTRGREI